MDWPTTDVGMKFDIRGIVKQGGQFAFLAYRDDGTLFNKRPFTDVSPITYSDDIGRYLGVTDPVYSFFVRRPSLENGYQTSLPSGLLVGTTSRYGTPPFNSLYSPSDIYFAIWDFTRSEDITWLKDNDYTNFHFIFTTP